MRPYRAKYGGQMPKQVSEAEFEAIVNAVRRLAEGGSVRRIWEALGETMPRRTLQRRLAALVAQGRLVREGRGPGALYRLAVAQSAHPAQAAESEDRRHLRVNNHLNIHEDFHIIHHIPVSEEGAEVGRLVRAPI